MPLLTTKLYIPPIRPELVSRPRLTARLDAGLERKLTLVSAPAGFGKTTLVVEWLAGQARPFAWLSLDEGDNDPVRFVTYLVAALQGVDENLGRTAQNLLGAPQLPSVEGLVTCLVNDVAATPEPFVLVLDDYHTIQAQWIHQAIEFLLTHQPPQLHLVLITRQAPPLPLPRLRVRGQLVEIYEDDLRFTVDEAHAFLTQALGMGLDGEIVAALEARTEGWVAGLQLAALSMRDKPQAQIAEFVHLFRGSHRHVIDYLAEEVLAQQPAEVRDFLRQTSILERFTAPLCDAVTGRGDSQALLRRLDQANLFLIPLDEQRQWARYHHLFADFLRTELDAAHQAALHRKASRWLAEHGLLPEAVKHALASGDVEQAAGVIRLASAEAFRTASFVMLQGWLDALPDEVVRADVELAICQGFVLFFTGRMAEVSAYAQAAERCLPADAAPSVRGRLLSLQAHLALCHEQPQDAARFARESLAFLEAEDVAFRYLTLNLLGQVLEMQGDVAAAVEVYGQAARSERNLGNQVGALVVLTNLVFALNELGRRREALAVCQQAARDVESRLGRATPMLEGIDLFWSLLSYEANELEQAREQVGRALGLMERMNVVDGIVWSWYILARVHLAGGDLEAMRRDVLEGRRYIAQADLYAGKGLWFTALKAQANLQEGDLPAAARWATAAGLAPDDAPHQWDEMPYFVYARLLLTQTRTAEAGILLATMERSAGEAGRGRKLITIYLLQARVRRALGEKEQALAYVEKALRLAAPEGYRRAFLDEGQEIVALLPQVRHLVPDFVDQILAAAGAPAIDQPPAAGPALIEPLTGREIEILRLIAAGRSNPEIADHLYLSLNTIKWHVKNLYGKLGVGNRIEAAARGQELDLL